MKQLITRRSVLAGGFPAALAAAVSPPVKPAKPLPAVGEFVRYVDPTTESIVVRLTNPSSSSYLPAAANRFVSLRERFLIFSSDRTGHLLPYGVDLHTGLTRPLALTTHLVPESLCLDAAGKQVYLLDGADLKQVALGGKKVNVLAGGVSAYSLARSTNEVCVVKEGRLELLRNPGSVIAEDVAPWCELQPEGRGCAFGRTSSNDTGEQEFWYTPLSVSSSKEPRLLAKGLIRNPLWSPDGGTLLFLRQLPANGNFVTEIHEVSPEIGVEQIVSKTSQFAALAVNGDGSVFVGASASKAQPTIVILLRSVQRELTLCEHRATDPAAVRPVFSPDSRRVYFQSNHQGKTALYSVNVEALVEPTLAGIS